MNIVSMPKRPKGWIDPGGAMNINALTARIEREKAKDAPICTSCHTAVKIKHTAI